MAYCNGCKRLNISTGGRSMSNNRIDHRATCTKFNEELRAVSMQDPNLDLTNLPALEGAPGIIVFTLPKCKGKE